MGYYKTTIEDKIRLFSAGNNNNIKLVSIRYSGGGDEGCIDEIAYHTKEDIKHTLDKITLEEDYMDDLIETHVYSNYNDISICSIFQNDANLSNLIESLAMNYLNDVEDWWNNDGGYGLMLIDLISFEYRIRNSCYITDTESFNHEGNVF